MPRLLPHVATRLFCLLFVASCALAAPSPDKAGSPSSESIRWDRRAKAVRILRDEWGIPHIHGHTDADAVFGMMYAQAEDDFNRIEMNILNGLGRVAEAEGEGRLSQDLRVRLFIDQERLPKLAAAAPTWLRELLKAWADGLNFYLAKHPEVHPKVLSRFEPWMALGCSEGSIGWDLESVPMPGLEAFYGRGLLPAEVEKPAVPVREAGGSNGFAIAPKRSASGSALLFINPHTTFYFRAEAQVQSDQGLNAYGAATWGQFFIYQGFNEQLGWMHTTAYAGKMDEYLETVLEQGGKRFYRYGKELRPIVARKMTLRYRTGNGLATRIFTTYHTHHGPVVREEGGKWVTVKLMQEPVKALTQAFLRTKARDYGAFRRLLELHTNSSNNTIYADAQGNIAFFHGNFIPRRNPQFDWSRAVDGSDPATEWQGLHTVAESPHLLNPPTGWIQNTNNWPYSAAGPDSPKERDFPAYFDRIGENARGIHALALLSKGVPFTLDGLIALAHDTHLPAFAVLVPSLMEAYRAEPDGSPLKASLAEPIAMLEAWDHRWSIDSIPTTLAVVWGEELWRVVGADAKGRNWSWLRIQEVARLSTPAQRLQALATAVAKLDADFGTWKTPWGQINRLQRLTNDGTSTFSDTAPSLPVGFLSSQWGSLAAFQAKAYPGTKRRYGSSGNSFVAAVEFGKKVRAKAILVGGESGDPASPHFNDQAERYAAGALRDVHFYPQDLAGHVSREYHPGQ